MTCPLKFKFVTKVFHERSEGLDKNRKLARQFLRLVEVDKKVDNPWEKTAHIQADGTVKIDQGVEKLLLSKKQKEKFLQTVRVNAKLKDFRKKAYYDIDSKLKKLEVYLTFDDFKKNCRFRHQRGIPDIIMVTVALLYD